MPDLRGPLLLGDRPGLATGATSQGYFDARSPTTSVRPAPSTNPAANPVAGPGPPPKEGRAIMPVMGIGRLVLLNGTPVSGKTSVSVELQRLMLAQYGVPWLTFHIDEFILMSMKSFRGQEEGFRHERLDDGTVRLAFSDRVRPLADAVAISAAACARAGFDVIADGPLFDARAAKVWDEQLRGLQHWRVGLKCPIEVLRQRSEERERAGGLPADLSFGLSRHYFDLVHQHAQYDLEIDTSHTDSVAAAQEIADLILEKT